MKLKTLSGATIVFSLLLFMFSCQSTPNSVVYALVVAEKYMDTHPDSAYQLLKSIPNPQKLYGKMQANYSLLMTQAMDKNYVKFESDSLIVLAVNYYRTEDDDLIKKGKSFFYYGRVMKELNKPEEAMKFYLKSRKVFDETKEYRMLGLIAEEMAMLNWSQRLSNDVLPHYKKALQYYGMIKDPLGMSYTLRSIGRYYLSDVAKIDSAYIYYQQALAIAHENKCNSELPILQELGLLYRGSREYEKAEYYLLQALKLDGNVSMFSGVYLSLGYTYLLMGKMDEAEIYLKKASNFSNEYTQVGAYDLLFKLEKLRNDPWKAIEYKEKSDSLSKIIQQKEKQEAVVEIQKKYENEKLKTENLHLEIKYQGIIMLCVVLFFVVLVGGFYMLYRSWCNKKKMLEIEQEIASNLEQIELYRKEQNDFQYLQDESEDYRSLIARLNGKMEILEKQNRTLSERLKVLGGEAEKETSGTEDRYIATFRTLLALKRGSYKGDLSRTDWEHVFDFYNFVYANMVMRLQIKAPSLTKHNLEICCLLKFRFCNEDLGRIFMTTSDSVTKAKGRIKKILNLPPEVDLDEYLRNF